MFLDRSGAFDDLKWAPIQGYESLYEVSDNGEIRALERTIAVGNGKLRRLKGGILMQRVNNRGYWTARICKEGRVKTCFVHRLMAQAFIPNPNNYPIVNHISGITTDNVILNLEWCTESHNVQHAYDTGLNSNKGGFHAFSVGVVDNISGKHFATIKEFCEHYGINYNSGRNYLNGYNKKLPSIDLSKNVFKKVEKGGENDNP